VPSQIIEQHPKNNNNIKMHWNWYAKNLWKAMWKK